MYYEFTLTLQKLRMPQILGVEGEAVVLEREPSTTPKIQYPKLSGQVNNMVFKRKMIEYT